MTPTEMARIHKASFITPRPWNEKEILEILSSPGCFLEHLIGGFFIARVIADEAELLTLAVDPLLRRKGIGKILVERFLRHAKSKGAYLAFLEVASNNHAAQALYKTAGFVESATRKKYYSGPGNTKIDAKIMTTTHI